MNHEIEVTCPNCGHEYDARLHFLVCPNCGHDRDEQTNTQQRLKKIFANGVHQISPKIKTMSDIMAECYQIGFQDCWKFFTGEEINLKEQ